MCTAYSCLSCVQTCINLAEQHGKEGPITGAYRDNMKEANLADAKYFTLRF
jgi:hypothetical protein